MADNQTTQTDEFDPDMSLDQAKEALIEIGKKTRHP